MTFKHHKWEKSGRTLYDISTGQYKYEAGLGEQQTWDGLKWLPYLWKSASNELQYGHNLNNIEFASDKQILKSASQVLCSSMKFFVQAKIGKNWVNQSHGIPTKNISDNYPSEGRCTGYLDFPDAHLSFGAQNPYNLQIDLEVGRSEKATFGFRMQAPISGQVRFQVVLDGLEKLPASGWEWIEDRETRDRIGIRVKDLEWRWSDEEVPYREIVVDTNTDGTKRISIIMGPYDSIANELLVVYPDTWGPTGVAAQSDDADLRFGLDIFGATSTYLNVGDRYGDSSGAYGGYSAGARFNSVLSGEVGALTVSSAKLTLVAAASESSTTVNLRILGIDEDDTITWTTGNHWLDRVATTAETKWSNIGAWTGGTAYDSPDIASIIQEIIDRVGWAHGNDLGLFLDDDDDSPGSDHAFRRIASYDHASYAPPKLTIVFTAAGGEEFTKDLSDTINLSDIRITNFGLPKADSISLTDGVVKNFGMPKVDVVSLSEGIAKSVGMSKVDIISLSEGVIKNVGISKTDVISLSDNFSSAVAFLRSLDDTVNLLDNFSKATTFLRVLNDTATLSDEVVKALDLSKSDNISMSDSFSLVVAFLRSLNDTVNLSDGIAKNVGTIKVDTINLSDDLISTIRAILMSLSDTINLSDGTTKNIGIVKDDMINISDNFNRVIIFLRVLDDTISISDSESLEVGLNKSDVIALSDIFAKEDLVVIIITAPEGRSIIIAAENRYITVEAENRFTTVITN